VKASLALSLGFLVTGALGAVLACPKVRTSPKTPEPAAVASSAPAPTTPAIASASEAPSASASGGSVEAMLPPPVPTSACNEQSPLPFLIRANFIPLNAKKDVFDKSIKFRTENYGWVKGFGQKDWNPTTPESNATDATFMGLKVRMNKKVVPALGCVEVEIKRACNDSPYEKPYTPLILAGIRYVNTYKGGEVTNHMYGIAIDVDPQRNSCCNCVKPWKDSPLCKKKAKSIWERMDMPECWVKSFEKFGFYWLGHDVLQDTMHFEFLGDPEKILRKPTQ